MKTALVFRHFGHVLLLSFLLLSSSSLTGAAATNVEQQDWSSFLWDQMMDPTSRPRHSDSDPKQNNQQGKGDNRNNDRSSRTIQKFAAVDAPGVLNVHIVPHTHDDVGWRKTVDQYFYGWNNSIDERGRVGEIISTTIDSLLQNDARTFTYVESKFLHMWWHNVATPHQQAALAQLLHQTRQATIANGGWSMHDEAAPHYMGMIDQTSTGHDFLQRHLQFAPTIAWQLDPFGHSATHAQFCHTWGNNALFLGRIDYQDLALRRHEQRCEGLWKPNVNQYSSNNKEEKDNHHDNEDNINDNDSAIFMGLTGSYYGNYGPPDWSFMFDNLYQDTVTPLTHMNQTQFHNALTRFLQLLAQQARETATPDIFLTMGSDFTFSQAEYYFSNLDLLIHSLMLGQEWNAWNMTQIFDGVTRVNVFYSTPDYYTQRKYQQTIKYHEEQEKQERLQQQQQPEHLQQQNDKEMQQTSRRVRGGNQQESKQSIRNSNSNEKTLESLWTTKTDDFFPYSDCPHCFWTGYFTSRTAFKRLERASSAFLHAARQLDVLFLDRAKIKSAETHPLFALEDALGVAQHHDAVSGTAMQHVSDDYTQRLQAGLAEALPHLYKILLEQLFCAKSDNDSKNNKGNPLRSALRETMQYYCPSWTHASSNPFFCTQLDPANTNAKDRDLYVMVYNPLNRRRNWTIRVPVKDRGVYVVERLDSSGNEESTIVMKLDVGTRCKHGDSNSDNDEPATVQFNAVDLQPLGLTTFRISLQRPYSQNDEEKPCLSNPHSNDSRFSETSRDGTIKVSNGQGLSVSFNRKSGQVVQIGDVKVSPQWGYYIPYDDKLDGDGQNSGAYIFRPSEANETLKILPLCDKDSVKFLHTNVGVEVHTSYGEDPNSCWVKQIARVVEGSPWIEFEYTVGPVPIENGRGKEIVSRFLAPEIENESVFYTDSNGRSFLKRVRDFRPSWNYSDVYEPVAGNYYPVNAAIYMEDTNASIAVLTDRSRGGSSIVDGSLEIMVQRRTVADDHRGVDEPLNETVGGMTPYPPYGNATRVGEGVVVSGVHRVLVGDAYAGAKVARSAMDQVFAEPLMFVSSSPSGALQNGRKEERAHKGQMDVKRIGFNPSLSLVNKEIALPSNLFLVTLMRLYDSEPSSDSTAESLFRIRLGHQYGPGEDVGGLSKPIDVDIAELLDPARYTVLNVTEMTLSGNQRWADFVSSKYNWTNPLQSGIGAEREAKDVYDSSVVTLQPLNIKTFHVRVEQSS